MRTLEATGASSPRGASGVGPGDGEGEGEDCRLPPLFVVPPFFLLLPEVSLLLFAPLVDGVAGGRLSLALR